MKPFSRFPGGALPCRLATLALLLALLPAAAWGGQIRGRVLGPDHQPLPGVTVTLANGLTGYSQTVTTDKDGAFRFTNVPDNPYHLRAELLGFRPAHVDLDVRGSIPVEKSLELAAGFAETTTVTAAKEAVALETDDSSTHTDIDKSLVRRFPAAVASRAFEAIVLSAPGFSQDENGRYHFQGGHSQQLLVIDGQPIGDQVGVTFSNSLNPAIAEGIEIVTGGTPAEYGEKAYGVINLTTRSALGQSGFHGDVTVGGARFSTLEGGVAAGWGSSRYGLFVDLDGSRSDRFLDPVSFDNFHNHGTTRRGFLRYDLAPSSASSLRLTANGGKTDRDVTNLPSQQVAGQDQRVSSKDWNLNLGYQRVLGASAVFEAQVYGRDNRLELRPSAGDTPVTAEQNRSLGNQGMNLSLSEYENILLSSSPAAASLVPPAVQASHQLGSGEIFNPSERHNAYTAGLQQGIGANFRLDLSYWKRKVDNAADQDQFENTGIVFPLNFKGGDLSGWNARLDFGPAAGVRGYLSLGHVRAIYDPPFVGGLFLDAGALDTLTAGPFLIDHDQNLQEQLGLYWDIPRSGFWMGVTERYDSGLVTDAGMIDDVLASPDTAYAAPYIRFNADPQRVKPRTVWNLSLGARLRQYGLPFELQLDLLNAADEKGLYNFQSVFGGTHVIPPRTIAGRVRYLF